MGGLGRSITLAGSLVGPLVVILKLVVLVVPYPLAVVHKQVTSHTEEAAVESKVTVAALEVVVGNLQVACPCLGFGTWVAAGCCSRRGSCSRSQASAP